ncbi:MAG: DUF2946 family protein [Tepidisphaeraceae bacterium]|jgi:hypothetical protein
MKAHGHIFACRSLKNSVAIFLLIFEGIFLNVIVPGHTRGVVTLSGKCSATSMADLGCPFCARQSSSDPKHAPNGKEQSECAICNLAVRLTLPPAIDFVPPLVCTAVVIESPVPGLAPTLGVQYVRHDRAPPVFA